MRTLIAAFFTGLVVSCGYAQGTVILNNRTPAGDIIILTWDGMSGPGSLPEGATAQLFLLETNGQSVPLFPSTTFRTNQAAATYFLHEVLVTVPGYPAGSQVTIQLRAWAGLDPVPPAGASLGQSTPLNVILGGETPEGEMLPAATLAGMQWLSPLTPGYMYFTSISIQDSSIAFGIVVLAASDPPELDYLLEGSEDFTAWQPLITNPPPSFTIPYDRVTQKLRFFRLRMP